MQKLSKSVLAATLVVLLTSCLTVKAINPGRALTPDMGYFVIGFPQKIEPIQFGSRDVYAKLHQVDTGKIFYLPFTIGGELRLLAVKPGTYRFEDFVYMIGVDTVKGRDAREEVPKLLTQPPRRGGSILVSAEYPEEYSKEFTINAGEIVYIGGYSWESRFSFNEAAVVINRTFDSDGSVFYAVRSNNPNMPESMIFRSLAHE
jgi:hypothetical protein